MKNWLQKQTVVLTGASGGIGRELCKLLVQKYGANVIGVGRSEEKMHSLQEELAGAKGQFSYRLFDVGQKEAWSVFAKELQNEGKQITALIHNAGMFPTFEKALNLPAETIERVMQTNYFSAVYGTQALAPLLKPSKPSIVFICSSSALCTVAGTSAYSASKSAMKGFAEALQMEERGKKHIGIIYPGTTATELFRNDKNTKNSALDLVAMPAQRMAKKIARRILRRRRRAVLGWDAKFMHLTAKLFPVSGLALIAWVMKISKSKVFQNVYDYEKK